jgi:hypothetical protein
MGDFVMGLYERARLLLYVALTALLVGGVSMAQDFNGVTQAQLTTIYQGVLNQMGIWVGALFVFLAVAVGVMWIVNRVRGGTGAK